MVAMTFFCCLCSFSVVPTTSLGRFRNSSKGLGGGEVVRWCSTRIQELYWVAFVLGEESFQKCFRQDGRVVCFLSMFGGYTLDARGKGNQSMKPE